MLTKRGGRTLVGNLLWLPSSLIAWLLSGVWTTLLLVSMGPLLIFFPFERIQMWGWQPLMGHVVHFAFGRFRIEVDPRHSWERTVVFVQNHVSMLDGYIACRTIRAPLCGLENAAHLKLPGYGWMMRAANAIPVDKGAGRYARIAAAMKDRARRGISILTFPEGHRTLDGKVRPFRRGVFRMAHEAGLPIVPIAVRGAYRLLPKGAISARPATLEIYVAPPIETAGLTPDQLRELADRVHQVITAWVERREKRGDLCLQPFETQSPGEDSAASSSSCSSNTRPTMFGHMI